MSYCPLKSYQVFSIFRNKIHRLPPYIASFRHLTLFKAEQNPIEWPPKDVMDCNGDSNDSQVMSEWIKSMQSWMQDHMPSSTERKMSDDSQGDQSNHGDETV